MWFVVASVFLCVAVWFADNVCCFSLFLFLSGSGEPKPVVVWVSPSVSSSRTRSSPSTRTPSCSTSPRPTPAPVFFFLLRRRRHDVHVGSVFLVLLRCFDREKDQANRRTRHNVFSGTNFFSLVQAHRCRFFSLLFYSFVILSPRSLVLWLFLLAICGVPSSDP